MDDHSQARSADVRKLLLSAVVVGLSCSAPLAQAQQNPAGANAPKHGVAVVDISYVFKNSAQFNAQIEALKKEMESADGALKADRDRIMALEEQRNGMKVGSDEFKKHDEELARQKADFSIKQGTVRRDFLEKEAQVYYRSYLEVSNTVKYYCDQHNIGMVLRFNGDQVDPKQREDVMRAIMSPIVYQNSIDITPDIIALLGRGSAGAAGATGTPTAQRPGATTPGNYQR
jgi:Skp family chaperone for outer membrane proteins